MEPEITYTCARRNQALLIADLVLFSLGLAFLAPSTVLPALIRRLGGSPMAVGCLSLISSAGWMLPSLAASRIVRGRPLVKNLVLAPMVISRLVMVPLVGATAYLALRAPALAVVAVLLTYAFLIIGDGFCVGWYDLVAKAAPPGQRGRCEGSSGRQRPHAPVRPADASAIDATFSPECLVTRHCLRLSRSSAASEKARRNRCRMDGRALGRSCACLEGHSASRERCLDLVPPWWQATDLIT